MKLYSAMLNFKNSLDINAFINLIIENNKNNKYAINRIPNLVWNGKYNQSFSNGILELDFCATDENDKFSVRYKKNEDGTEWTTDYVLDFAEKKIAITLERSCPNNNMLNYEQFHAPSIVKELISKRYLCNDNELTILASPHYLKKDNLNLLKDIIFNTANYALPIVYISKCRNQTYCVDVDQLASQLRGIAHVVAQEEYELNTECYKISNGKDEYDGDIGLYFPSSDHPHLTITCKKRDDSEDIYQQIVSEISIYSVSKNNNPNYTYSAIQISKLDKEKAIAQRDYQNLFDAFDEELKDKTAKINDQESTILRLRSENNAYKTVFNSKSGGTLLNYDKSLEFFVGETQDIIVSSLMEYSENCKNLRVKEVIQNILEVNEYKGIREVRLNEFKKDLISAGNTNEVKRAFKKLGFDFISQDRHLKFCYYGNPNYVTIYATTPSDHRVAENYMAEIKSLI